MSKDNDGFKEIRLTFPVNVQITKEQTATLVKLVDEINENNTPDGCIMWNSGCGCLPTSVNVPEFIDFNTSNKHRSPEFDESVFNLDTSIKEVSPEENVVIKAAMRYRKGIATIEKKIKKNTVAIEVCNEFLKSNNGVIIDNNKMTENTKAVNIIAKWIESELVKLKDLGDNIINNMKKLKERK